MADEIKIIIQNKKREKINEIKTKRPRTFEMLLKFINEKIKEMPKFYDIYISKNGKGISIRSDEQYQSYKTKVVYILEKDMIDIAPTLIQKDEVYFEESMNNTMNNSIINNNLNENSDTKNEENKNEIIEINQKPKDENAQFIENISDILKKILVRFKEVDSLLPAYNEKLIELVNKFEPNLVISQINNISDIILEELKKIEDYIKSEGNNIGKKNLPKVNLKRKKHLVLPRIGSDKNVITQPNFRIYIPPSCIPKIQKNTYEDISFEKIGIR
jgi:Zn-dependent M32 family carboxypeptidase